MVLPTELNALRSESEPTTQSYGGLVGTATPQIQENRVGLTTKKKIGRPPIVRRAIICDENENGCHVFRGETARNQGYGRFYLNGKDHFAHRYCWEKEYGEIPTGLVVDHICRNRACCNVDHLRIVEQRVNALENNDGVSAINAAKTHCPQGHAYDQANTGICRGRKRYRYCRQCHANYRNKRKLKTEVQS